MVKTTNEFLSTSFDSCLSLSCFSLSRLFHLSLLLFFASLTQKEVVYTDFSAPCQHCRSCDTLHQLVLSSVRSAQPSPCHRHTDDLETSGVRSIHHCRRSPPLLRLHHRRLTWQRRRCTIFDSESLPCPMQRVPHGAVSLRHHTSILSSTPWRTPSTACAPAVHHICHCFGHHP